MDSRHLRDGVILLVVLAVFAGAMVLQADAGFFAVAVMGLALSNQSTVRFRWRLAENVPLASSLQLLLLLLLVARVRLAGAAEIGVTGAAFVVLLAVAVRPLAVGLATWGLALDRTERLSLAWAAPRGVLAVAVGTLCALRLADAHVPEAERLVPLLVLLLATTVILDAGSHAIAGRGLRGRAALSADEPAVAGRAL